MGSYLVCFFMHDLTFETFGVKLTSAANAGFLIALSVVVVPFLNVYRQERKQSKFIYFTCFMCVPCRWRHQLSFTANGNIEFNQGDILILSAALIRVFRYLCLVGRLLVAGLLANQYHID